MPSKLTSVLIGGLASALVGTLLSVAGSLANPANANPGLGAILGLLGCLTMVTSGLIAVWHYTGEHELTLTGGQGVGIGALAGIAYGVIVTVLSRILMMAGALPTAEDVIQQMEETGAMEGPGAEFATMMVEFSMGWGAVVFSIIFGVVTGLIGGAIGAAVFKRGTDS